MAGPDYAPPAKRSILIAGHQTSISLEPAFWALLEAEARRSGLSLNALVARVDSERLEAPRPPNLTSALRQFLLARSLGDRGSE